jgi:hypothetical protein
MGLSEDHVPHRVSARGRQRVRRMATYGKRPCASRRPIVGWAELGGNIHVADVAVLLSAAAIAFAGACLDKIMYLMIAVIST